MPFTDVIDDYSNGATGTLTAGDGKPVNYTVQNTGTTIDWGDLDGGARVSADGLHHFTVTFDKAVTGAMMQMSSGDSIEYYYVRIDGVTADLKTLIANGDVTMTQSNAATHTIRDDGGFAGGHHTDYSIMELTFHIPVTSLGAFGANGHSGNFDYFEVGLDTASSSVICFAKGTLIRTPKGSIPVEDLQGGDLIDTLDGERRPLRWIGTRRVGPSELTRFEKLRPVCIPKGALGHGLPGRDLLVSRQHRVVVSSGIVGHVTGSRDALIPAIKLTGLAGIHVDTAVPEVTYFHLLFDQHEVIFAEGAPCESLYTGPYTLEALLPQQRAELRAVFPDIASWRGLADPARPIPHRRLQGMIVKRHQQTGRPLLDLPVAACPPPVAHRATVPVSSETSG